MRGLAGIHKPESRTSFSEQAGIRIDFREGISLSVAVVSMPQFSSHSTARAVVKMSPFRRVARSFKTVASCRSLSSRIWTAHAVALVSPMGGLGLQKPAAGGGTGCGYGKIMQLGESTPLDHSQRAFLGKAADLSLIEVWCNWHIAEYRVADQAWVSVEMHA